MSKVITAIAVNEKTWTLHLLGGRETRPLCGPTWRVTAEDLERSAVRLDRRHLCGLCRRVLRSNDAALAAVFGHLVDSLIDRAPPRDIKYWLDLFQDELDRRRPERE